MKIYLTRDSVAMGDDVDAPHEETRDLPGGMQVHDAVAAVAESGYLAHIAGGKASWILTSASTPIAVLAQQWDAPQCLTPRDATLASLAGDDGVLRWHFLYRTQQSPVAVYEELRAAQTT